VQPSRCAAIPHGLPRSWGKNVEITEPPKSIFNEVHVDPTLFYVGDISEMDGVDVLMRAACDLRARGIPVRLLIIGDGTNAYRSELDRLISDLSMDDFVTHIASVPNGSLPKIIDRVSICVAPFRLEETSSTSIPNKVLEYLTSSKPIVVPAGSALQEIFGLTFSYFSPGDPVSLALAIETALAVAQVPALRKEVQRAMQWAPLMSQEWALIESVAARQVGDARRFDYRLSERLTGEVGT
jgi:glycosyltransferase involved in cell wall biosynthesis